MSVRDFLQQHHVFSLDEFRGELGEGRTSYNLLIRATKRGLVDRVMRGVYVSRSGKFANEEPDPFMIATAVSPEAVMVYHSALELHGLAHSPARRVQFSTTKTTPPFTYRGVEFHGYEPPKFLSQSEATQWTTLIGRPDGVVRVTSRERTLVDCMSRMDRAGGLEEVLRSLSGLPYVDAPNVLGYLRALGSPTAAARCGWLLEQRAREWYVSREALEEMRTMLGKGPYYLTSDNERGVWVKPWKLYLPASASQLDEWVNE